MLVQLAFGGELDGLGPAAGGGHQSSSSLPLRSNSAPSRKDT